MEHDLMNSRKIAIVTGGSSGLGSALIDALKNDYFVVNISRSAATNADANIAADLTVEAGRLSAVNEIKNKFTTLAAKVRKVFQIHSVVPENYH